MRTKLSSLTAALAAALTLAACGGRTDSPAEAEPLPPQPYGEEESNFDVWLDTMELSNRELYAAREAVLETVGVQPGHHIADLGAGTGLYTLLFSPVIGESGVVYAVDIEPRFLRLVNQRAADLGLQNVVAVLSREDDITLPAQSVDLVFIADTYHYFGDPEAVMRSVWRALKDDGRIIVVDYNYDPDQADSPSRDHLRFGKEGLIEEAASFGFRLKSAPEVDGLSDFYMLVFEKAAPPTANSL